MSILLRVSTFFTITAGIAALTDEEYIVSGFANGVAQ